MKTTNKTAANLAFAAAAALIGGIATIKIDPTIDSSKAEIFAPAHVEAGALTIFSTQGTDVNWSIHPDIPSQTFGENNSSLATSFQRPGDYLVICAWTDQEGHVQLRKHEIVSEVPGPTPAPPLPVDPEPAVEPEEPISVLIIPEPIPDPIPDSLPDTAFPDVAQRIVAICTDTNLPREKACELARNFESIAVKIDSGDYATIAGLLHDTSVINRPVVNVGPATTQIQLLVSRKRFDGELGSVPEYADLWHEIAAGLNEYGQCN